jgi:hypothetical protein
MLHRKNPSFRCGGLLTRRYNFVDKACVARRYPRKSGAIEQNRQGGFNPHQAREALCTAGAGQQADKRFWQA